MAELSRLMMGTPQKKEKKRGVFVFPVLSNGCIRYAALFIFPVLYSGYILYAALFLVQWNQYCRWTCSGKCLSDSFRSESSSHGRAISYSWRAMFRGCIMQGRKTAKGSKDRIEHISHHQNPKMVKFCPRTQYLPGLTCTPYAIASRRDKQRCS